MPISIYPPILQSTQSAFLATTPTYPIYFTLQTIMSFNDIKHIQIRVVSQSNNKTVVNTALYPDGIIYKASSFISQTGNQYYISINSNDLAKKWDEGALYKIQLRFGINSLYNSISDFATWKQQQINQEAFSEWSTVMIIKAIDTPSIIIANDEAKKDDVIATERTEATLTPLFNGYYHSEYESLDKYKFDLYAGNEIGNDNLIESSGWVQHNSSQNNEDLHRFKTVLTNGETYTVVYSILTVNGYEGQSTPYTFLANQTYLPQMEGFQLIIDDKNSYCKDNGCIRLYGISTNNLNGTYVITRSSNQSNFSIWEDLKYLQYFNESFDNNLIFEDFTIESGIQYKYAIQKENSAGIRTQPIYENSNPPHQVDFEYSYLYRDGIQLKLQFDQTLSSFKYTTLRSKQDTIGDKYAHLVQNGNAYYAEFPISGLISFQMDTDQTFFNLRSDGYYYKDELVIPKDKFLEEYSREDCGNDVEKTGILFASTDLTDNNIFIERIFRKKAEQFLNDFNYKLYKSPTEGNIVIGLLNVSLTPNATLGRMIYSFSATAYEVMENTLSNLNEVNIIDIGEFEPISADEISISFGQIQGVYGKNIDLMEKIREQEQISVSDGYKMNLIDVTDLLIERYPNIDLTAEILRLKALQAEAANAGESTSEYDQQIEEYEKLQQTLSGPLETAINININGTPIIIAPNKVYHLKEPIYSLTLTSSIVPIIINYICELNQVEDTESGIISAIDSSRIWGQISGIFTGTDSVLKFYNYDYVNSDTNRVFSYVGDKQMQALLIYDTNGNLIGDNTTFDVYKTVNIYEIIKEETRRQVENIYSTNFELDSDGNWVSLDGNRVKMQYNFSDIILFDIEADEGTTLYLSQQEDGSNPITIKIGPTGRYTLNPLDNMIKYIALKEPQFCVINYKCITSQMIMG